MAKNDKPKKKKLALRKDVIRPLSESDLEVARGGESSSAASGFVPRTDTCQCDAA